MMINEILSRITSNSHRRNRMKTATLAAGFLSASLVMLGAAVPTDAAVVNWATPVTISGDADVMTGGTFKFAYDWQNSTQTVNGVIFTGTTGMASVGSDLTLSGFNQSNHNANFATPITTSGSFTTAYRTVLNGALYNATNNATGTVTINNLTIGHVYAIQFWVDDSRAGIPSRNETLTSTGGNTVTLDFNNIDGAGGFGQYSIGTFAADALTQAFTITGVSAPPQMNAIQVRDLGVSIPTPAALPGGLALLVAAGACRRHA